MYDCKFFSLLNYTPCICKIKSAITQERDVTIHLVRKWLLRHTTTNNNVRYMASYALIVKLTGRSMTVHVYIFAVTFWHRSFTFNSNKSPTWCNHFSVYYPGVCLQLNMFRAFSRPSSGAQWLQWQPLVLPSYRGDSRAVFVVGPAGRQQDCHHDTKVKPEAPTAVTELLMMGGKTPETCRAVNKRQDNKLKNCCIRLVIYLN